MIKWMDTQKPVNKGQWQNKKGDQKDNKLDEKTKPVEKDSDQRDEKDNKNGWKNLNLLRRTLK